MSSSNQPSARHRGRGWLAACATALLLTVCLPAIAQSAGCLQSPAVQPWLYAGGKAGARPATLHYSAVLARAGLVAAGPAFDGPALLQAMADPWARAGAGPGGEPAPRMESRQQGRQGQEDETLRIERSARFIHVALPERREGRQVLYGVYRFALVPGAAVYRVVLASPPQDASCAPPQSGAPSVDAAVAATVSWKGVRLSRVTALDRGSFPMPQTSVPLTVGRRQPDLYQAATDALKTRGFSQSSGQAAASRPDELVLGSAAGMQSASDFDVKMRLLGKGMLDIAVLSTRNPMEINEERTRARELSDRVLNAFPMLSPVEPRATPSTPPSATTQEKKP